MFSVNWSIAVIRKIESSSEYCTACWILRSFPWSQNGEILEGRVFQGAKQFFYSRLSAVFLLPLPKFLPCFISSPYILLYIFLPFGPIDSCTGQDLADLGDRLRDWFQLLQGSAKQNNTRKPTAATSASSKVQSSQLSAQPLIWFWKRLHRWAFAEAA